MSAGQPRASSALMHRQTQALAEEIAAAMRALAARIKREVENKLRTGLKTPRRARQ